MTTLNDIDDFTIKNDAAHLTGSVLFSIPNPGFRIKTQGGGLYFTIPLARQVLFSPGIYPKYFDKPRNFSKMLKRLAHGLILAAQYVHEEHVLPGLPMHRPGFNLAQIQIPQGKNAERLKQGARYVLE